MHVYTWMHCICLIGPWPLGLPYDHPHGPHPSGTGNLPIETLVARAMANEYLYLLYTCSFLSKPVTNLISFARPRPSLSSLRRSQNSRTISQNWTTPAPWCRNWLRSTLPLPNPTTSQEGYPARGWVIRGTVIVNIHVHDVVLVILVRGC